MCTSGRVPDCCVVGHDVQGVLGGVGPRALAEEIVIGGQCDRTGPHQIHRAPGLPWHPRLCQAGEHPGLSRPYPTLY